MGSLKGRPRLLPMAIGGMAVLAGFKLTLVMQAGGGVFDLASAGRAVFPPALASNGASAAAPGPAKGEGAGPVVGVGSATPLREASKTAEKPEATAVDPGPSDAERALLQDLRARRLELEARDKVVAGREALLAAAERRLSERVEQLTALQTRLEAMEQTRRERDEANWRGLVKTYEAMRPRDAAAIFNELDRTVLMEVLDRMKEAKAGAVLAAMQPERARAATAALAAWRTRVPETKG